MYLAMNPSNDTDCDAVSIPGERLLPPHDFQQKLKFSFRELTQKLLTSPISETKYLISRSVADLVSGWAQVYMQPDQHADPALGDGYWVRTLYLDTPGADIYHRRGVGRSRKFRVRGYGSSPELWLEMKWKRREKVRKRRTVIHQDRLPLIMANSSQEHEWFSNRVHRYQLQPACQITYRRQAYLCRTSHGVYRLTLDREAFSQPHDGWRVPLETGNCRILNAENAILELKYQGDFPIFFRSLVELIPQVPCSYSKYRRAISTLMDQSMGDSACPTG
ncbi:VTC domain protein [Planctopirus ephydatiae]|uniref:VTC domain protein n=1 Tax=Planctopirus ephydatiae TaxID=2528019 RepID=A0A518GTP3_9PLAN|nr:polyphosphate polymerase domain-containing protein [Planctopirus ephydatiae]QDV31953.1 VTC domain protein [Planctopirus ephydatiae]